MFQIKLYLSESIYATKVFLFYSLALIQITDLYTKFTDSQVYLGDES
jgi:hypothetical protein